ncbi:hypothetical protein FDO65_17410 [Nakamurella flava]|uniref:Uncharacterized protein n=2 Tax=Nakamurella flava TaxID=2576308 RepID=A0A4U6QBZ5_9ACTN|nr:hypothetical protein FDO65_17410 [Nakamurella flava]
MVIGGAAVLLIGGGAAYAYWSSTGVGEGEVDTGTAPAFVVSSTPGTGGPLSPGGPTETVAFSVANPSSGVLNLASVTAAVANADGTAWNVGNCTAADFTVGTPAITYGEIAAGADADGTVTVQMINRAQNQDDCQGLTVPIYFVAS